MGDIVDIGPRIRRKKLEICEHNTVSVSMTSQSLTCDECENEVDPWVWIRDQCLHYERWQAYDDERRKALNEEFNKLSARLQAQLNHAQEEVNRLIDTKNRLNAEAVNGVKLRDAKRYTRKRKAGE